MTQYGVGIRRNWAESVSDCMGLATDGVRFANKDRQVSAIMDPDTEEAMWAPPTKVLIFLAVIVPEVARPDVQVTHILWNQQKKFT